jgi:hypothetical protein
MFSIQQHNSPLLARDKTSVKNPLFQIGTLAHCLHALQIFTTRAPRAQDRMLDAGLSSGGTATAFSTQVLNELFLFRIILLFVQYFF